MVKREKILLHTIAYPQKRETLGTQEYFVFDSIPNTYNGQSIIKKIIDVYFYKTCIHELNVMEYNGKYYTLKNEKLWILKTAEIARGPLKVT